MLFINAAMETDQFLHPHGDVQGMMIAMKRLEKYIPLDNSQMGVNRAGRNISAHPDLVLRTACYDMFKPWDKYFDNFMDEMKILQVAQLCGMNIKKKPTLIQPWPYKIGVRTTKKQFDILHASGTTGFERYMEFEKSNDAKDDVSTLHDN
jgi:hypothetical protein